MEKQQQINFQEGSINFWVPENTFSYNDGLLHILVNNSNENGSILITKDADNRLKIFHVLLGKGRTDIDVDVQNLTKTEKHMFTVTWSIKRGKIILYVDGGEIKTENLNNKATT